MKRKERFASLTSENRLVGDMGYVRVDVNCLFLDVARQQRAFTARTLNIFFQQINCLSLSSLRPLERKSENKTNAYAYHGTV